jgi:acetyltransferase-like isoleucine patch superfamily enzyme
VTIGRYSTFAGFRSQILTHSIDLKNSKQSCKPVSIGEYCFVGTGCVILGGSRLPSYSVLGANALLNSSPEDTYSLYAGVPAKKINSIPKSHNYFYRKSGFVD